MARPEDTLARGNVRNGAGYGDGYDNPQDPARRDPRRPFDQRGREEPPMRAANATQAQRAQSPGLNPQFDPYTPGGQPVPQRPQSPPPPQTLGRPLTQDPRVNYRPEQRQDLPPQQGYGIDPYAQQRGQRPNPAMPQQNDRYAGAPQGAPQGVPNGATQGRPGQSMRPSVQGFPQQQAGYTPLQGQPRRPPAEGQGYDGVPPTGRVREPFFEAPPSARQAPMPLARQPSGGPAGLAQDGYGPDDRYAETHADASFEDDEFEDEDEGEDDHEEAVPRSRRGLIISAALVVAIALGGGLGYVYKLSGGHASANASPPVVTADAGPVKAIPAVADQVADPNKKTIMERPDTAAGNPTPEVVASQEQVAVTTDQASDSGDNLAGPRKVATVVVKPGQKIDAAPSQDGQAVDAIPGISLDGVDPASKPVGQTKAASGQMKTASMQPAAAPPEPDAQPADAGTAPDGAAADEAAAAQQPVKLGKAARKMKVAAVAPDAGSDAVPPDPTMPARTASTGSTHKASGSGYLIQVRSTKTQTEALAYFADLQQRYGDLLGNAQPDIQEADLGAKGKWFRLRIGPPGSGAAAKDLCTKLKASGLDACIVAPY